MGLKHSKGKLTKMADAKKARRKAKLTGHASKDKGSGLPVALLIASPRQQPTRARL